MLLPAAAAGGLLGGVLLLVTPDRVFAVLVPVLILAAVLVLALGDRVKRAVAARVSGGAHGVERLAGPTAGVFAAAVYGGYFGGGLGIILLAVLGAVLVDSLTRLNALKQCISLVVNGVAAAYFLFAGLVVWEAAVVMCVCALAGGFAGGRVAGRLPARVLQRVVLAIGVAVAAVYVVRAIA